MEGYRPEAHGTPPPPPFNYSPHGTPSPPPYMRRDMHQDGDNIPRNDEGANEEEEIFRRISEFRQVFS